MRETNNNRVYEEGKRFAGGCEENNGNGGECAFEGRRVSWATDSAPEEPRHDLF